MNKILVNLLNTIVIIAVAIGILVFSSLTAQAAEIPKTYTSENFWSSPHDVPVFFTQDTSGNFIGITATGKIFTQTNIFNSYDIRLQRFSIDEASFYITNRGIIIAPNDLIAISIYLNRSA